jgi:Zn-dependent peptidase ImmA (M78 family)
MNTVQARAREIRKRHHFSLPSDIERVMHAENIAVVRFPLAGRLQEMIVFNYVAIQDSIQDQRSIHELLAHALGHFLLHVGNQLVFEFPEDMVPAAKLERQAWDFAFELLMPAEMIEARLGDGWSDADLREHFEVSDEFYRNRMEAFRAERREVANSTATMHSDDW